MRLKLGNQILIRAKSESQSEQRNKVDNIRLNPETPMILDNKCLPGGLLRYPSTVKPLYTGLSLYRNLPPILNMPGSPKSTYSYRNNHFKQKSHLN